MTWGEVWAALKDGRLTDDEYSEIYLESKVALARARETMTAMAEENSLDLKRFKTAANLAEQRLLDLPSLGSTVTIGPNWDAEQVAALRDVGVIASTAPISPRASRSDVFIGSSVSAGVSVDGIHRKAQGGRPSLT